MTQAQPGIRLATILALVVLVTLTTSAAPVNAEEQANSASTEGQFAGVFVGAGQSSNTLLDIDGFADWGNPGSTTGYNKSGAVGGAFFGRQTDNMRYELEFMLGGLTAHTDKLDPTCTDESATSKLNWTLAARFGVTDSVGQTRAFAVAGPALASIDNSVTDIDFSEPRSCLKGRTWVDTDDSFRDSSTHFGWTLGFGIETEVAPNWLLRFEGVYFDFGKESYQVNLSRNNPCGHGPRAPCTYSIDNRLTALRIGMVYYFE